MNPSLSPFLLFFSFFPSNSLLYLSLFRYCTRFTDDVFNALLGSNFLYEAAAALSNNFLTAGKDLTQPFVEACLGLSTFVFTNTLVRLRKTRYFTAKVRSLLSDFGPVIVILSLSYANTLPFLSKFNLPTLPIPSSFELCNSRPFFVDLSSVPTIYRWLTAIPALFLTSLFFFDQNISVRTVNSALAGCTPDGACDVRSVLQEASKQEASKQECPPPTPPSAQAQSSAQSDNAPQKLKGKGYSLDMMALAIVTAGASAVGLPWMCGATVQSIANVNAMTIRTYNPETESEEITGVVETRVTGLAVHVLIGLSLTLLPLLSLMPTPIVSGVFLYLGKRVLSGNEFIWRVLDGFKEMRGLEEDHPFKVVGRGRVVKYTAVQAGECIYRIISCHDMSIVNCQCIIHDMSINVSTLNVSVSNPN